MPDLDRAARRLDAGERVTAIAADLSVTPRTIRDGYTLPACRSRRHVPANVPSPSSQTLGLRQQYVDDRRNASTIARI